MVVKAATSWLTTDSDPLFANNVSVVTTAMAANLDIYKAPNPTLEAVNTALDNFSAAVVLVPDGGPSATAKKNNLRLILVGLMRQLANYVTDTCNGDMEKLLLSGFPIQKPTRQSVGPLPAPTNVTLKLNGRTGELAAKANPVFGSAIYTWRLTANGSNSPEKTVQTTAARVMFDGLTPGVTYSVAVNAIGTAGPSDWSNPASQMAV